MNSPVVTPSRLAQLRQARSGRTSWREKLAPFLVEGPLLELDGSEKRLEESSLSILLSIHWLQDLADYRGAIQGWFQALRPGGRLIIVVPHTFLYERRLALPPRWHAGQRRLYTPAILLSEVEEALEPNSYRIRSLSDEDDGYDYDHPGDVEPTGRSDVFLVLEKIALPSWTLAATPLHRAAAPDYSFETPHTRIEMYSRRPHQRIVALKLDHLGDLVMSISALEKLRATFPEAHITLVVGSWNADMARALGLANEVIPFDVFPRNSTEEEVDVPGKTALFQATVTGRYDLAIDLRTDTDTRFLLRHVDASIRAGVGAKAQFPYLDIFLPLTATRNEWEAAREENLNHHAFASQHGLVRRDHRLFAERERMKRNSALVWGPYRRLRAGRYMFDPFLEIDPEETGLLMIDIGLDGERVEERLVSAGDTLRLEFTVTELESSFEFRVWMVDELPAPTFNFFGGRLIRQGAASVLHQSEYQLLLIELVRHRLMDRGVLAESIVP